MANTLKFGNGEWATKEGSTLAYNDENGNFKPLPFDFSRNTTATRVNKEGLIEVVPNNEPRIDFLDNSDGALKLEPQRTNLITYSEDFSQWSKIGGVVVTNDFTISPDGTQNASRLVYDGTASGRVELSASASGTVTQSVYLKTESGTQAVSIGAGSSSLLEVTVTNEWQRFEFTGSGNFPRILCNDVATIYAWGAQLEQGSYATSYIPTQGSTVTRVADTCSQTPPSGIIGQTEGTMFVEVELKSASEQILIITSASGNEVNRLQIYIDANRKIGLYRGDNSVNILSSSTYSLNSVLKIAAVYKSNDYALYVNGVSVGTDTSGTIPPTPSLLYLGSYVDGSKSNTTIIKQAQLYNTRLSNSELATLTTL